MEKSYENDQRLVTSEMLENLPDPVQRYMDYTGVVGTPWIDTVRLKQVGTFRPGHFQRSWQERFGADVL
jgi:hypothetical protein